jgi:hypothetical protein
VTANKLLRNINVLNLALAAVILCFAFYLLFPLTEMPVTYNPPPVKKPAPGKTETEPPLQQTHNPMEYTLIADQNLFHPERKIPPEKKAEAPLPKPEFVLYGTLITGDLGIAYLEDKKGAPVTTPGRGKRQTALKKGESLSGFILKELFNDRVVMNRGEETMTVYLNDAQAPKAREGVPDQTKTAPKAAAAGAPPAPARPGTAPAGPGGPAGNETRPRATAAPQTAPTTAGTTPPAAVSGLPSPGTTAASPGGGTSGAFTPSRPRYRPVPSGGPYPAPSPSPSPIRPYP